MSSEDIWREVQAVGRPQYFFAHGKGAHEASVLAIKAWERANPDKAELYLQLFAQYEATKKREEDYAAQMAAEKRLAKSGAGARSIETASKPKPTDALKTALDWWGSDSWALVLYGPVGTGKTVAATHVLSLAAASSRIVMFRRVSEVVTLSDFDAGADEKRDLGRAGFLVLDDASAESLTERGRSILVEVLDARYEAKKRTVVTSNADWATLERRLGQRIASRLQHGGVAVEVKGKSMRGDT